MWSAGAEALTLEQRANYEGVQTPKYEAVEAGRCGNALDYEFDMNKSREQLGRRIGQLPSRGPNPCRLANTGTLCCTGSKRGGGGTSKLSFRPFLCFSLKATIIHVLFFGGGKMGVRFRSGVRFSPVQIEAELETITPGQVGPCNLDDRKEIKNILWVRHGLEGPNSKRDRDGLPPTDAAVSPPPPPLRYCCPHGAGEVAPCIDEEIILYPAVPSQPSTHVGISTSMKPVCSPRRYTPDLHHWT